MKTFFKVSLPIFFIVIFTSSSLYAAQKHSWHFPLEIKAGLSSNFGEFRGNRVHTGVDLRTNMETGYKVYAIDDGTIVRLSVRKLGFGKAVYIQHPNGLMSVYGHLDRFEENALGLETLVQQYRRRRGTKYPRDIYLEKPVKRGQLIAYSGETGYGLPHLHFEVRRGGATPIDPFEHGFEYKDTTPPVIESLIIEPLGSQSFLDGEHFAREYRTEESQGTYRIKHVPKGYGKVRFTIAAYDQIGAQNKCAVDRIDLYIAHSGVDKLDLYIDKEQFFSNQFDWVTYDTNHRGGLVYDFNLTRLSNPTQYYYRLYNLSPAHFPYHQIFARDEGIWDTALYKEGLHTIVAEIRDVVGNVSLAHMQVNIEKSASHSSPSQEKGGIVSPCFIKLGKQRGMEIRDFHDFIEVIFQSETPLASAPTLFVSQEGKRAGRLRSREMTSKGIDRFSGTYDLIPGEDRMLDVKVTATTQGGKRIEETQQFPVTTIFAKRGGTVRYGSKASMSFPVGALYQDIFANIFPTTSYEETPGLPLIGEVYDFRPPGCPLEKKGTIRIQYPKDIKHVKKLGIFWWDTIKRRWYFMDDELDPKTRSLKAKIIYPSIYAILQDTVKPAISDLVPQKGSTVSATHSTVSAIIKDVGKGVDEASIVMKLDGNRVDGEYDPDRRKFAYILTKKLKSGKHTLTVQASDKAGNPAESKTSMFIVR